MASEVMSLFRIRTITNFISLDAGDFADEQKGAKSKLIAAAKFLHTSKAQFEKEGYTVQTIRIATNPFGSWFSDVTQLEVIESVLNENDISFCSLGPATKASELSICKQIITKSKTFSCSANLLPNDVTMAKECAKLVRGLGSIQDGLGNFQFCVAAAASPNIPFFPVAKAVDGASPSFAVGLENGSLAFKLLQESGSLEHIPTCFSKGMADALQPIQDICTSLSANHSVEYIGIDTSLNPSLEDMAKEYPGSVAGAIETIQEVGSFGASGTLATAAAITRALQSLPGIQHCGYSGIMLPVCEDQRLASLSATSLSIPSLLSISHVCGVGVDTVPVPGNSSVEVLASLFLDVAGMAHRWNKSLSCRVFPVEGRDAGSLTEFDSPYMVNSHILSLT